MPFFNKFQILTFLSFFSFYHLYTYLFIFNNKSNPQFRLKKLKYVCVCVHLNKLYTLREKQDINVTINNLRSDLEITKEGDKDVSFH